MLKPINLNKENPLNWKLFTVLLCCLFTTLSLTAGVVGTVTANKLNLRVKDGTKYTKVAQVVKGEKLEVVKHKNGWYQVIAPSDATAWVSAQFVENGVITKEVHLRAGPSVAFSSYRFAEPGEKVTVLKTSKNKAWLKIAPPAGLKAWVSAQYVFLTPENAAKLAGKPAVTTEKKPENSDKSTAKPEDTKKEILPFMNSKGKVVNVEGYIVRLREGAKYVTHAVASKINGDYFPLSYIRSEKHNLNLWKDKRVTVTGEQRWVKGWQRPVVDVTKITPSM